jgi:hypothetical protein
MHDTHLSRSHFLGKQLDDPEGSSFFELLTQANLLSVA